MSYQYVRLGPDEIQPMRKLLRLFGEAFEEHGTYVSTQPRDAYLRDILGQKHFIVVTAIKGEEVVGGLTAYVLQKFEQERSEIYIYDLAVSKEHRRKGVATTLIQYLHTLARSLHAWVMFVQADPGDEPAIRLYESLGRRETVYHFDIPMDKR
jgi:aminoglycoside 3-N-acetyltransferase I